MCINGWQAAWIIASISGFILFIKLQVPGLVSTDEGSKPEILSRIAQTTAALTRLKPVWIDKSISPNSKIRLKRSLVTSFFLYACKSRTLKAELQRRIQPMEMRCYRKILHISYKDHVINEEVRAKIQPDNRKEMQTAVVWSCLLFISSGQNHLARHSERGKKTRQTKKEVERHQSLDRPGVRQVPESSGEQRQWRKLVVKSSVVSRRPPLLRDRWRRRKVIWWITEEWGKNYSQGLWMRWDYQGKRGRKDGFGV